MTIGAGVIQTLLAKRYCLPRWVYLREVSNGTGARHQRTADGVALDCYPSRGCELHGFEIKVDRRDWLREIDDPSKSEPVQRYCDRWWIVASAGLVKLEELPRTWGLIDVAKRGKDAEHSLRVKKKAPELEPVSWSRPFVASMMRASAMAAPAAADLAAARAEGVKEGRSARLSDHRVAQLERDLGYSQCQNRELAKSIEDFQRVSGIRLQSWTGARIGQLVHAFLNDSNPRSMIERTLGHLGELDAFLDRWMQTMKRTLDQMEASGDLPR